MADKVTKVTMVSGEDKREFDLTHAQDILKYQEEKRFTTGWQLKPDSGFEYKDGTINPTNSGVAEKPGKRGGNTAGDQP
jgi:hypothetical protein